MNRLDSATRAILVAVAVALALALTTLTSLARAAGAGADAKRSGTVLHVDDADIYIDLGTDQGVGIDSELVLLHVVIATHPVTGKKMRDAFPLGRVAVVNAGQTLSIAHAPDDLLPRVAVGDRVQMATEPRVFVDPWVERTRPKLPDGQLDMRNPHVVAERAQRRARAESIVGAADAVEAAWQRTLGKEAEERIAIWTGFLAVHTDTPYGPTIRSEIVNLREQIEERERRDSGVAQRARRVARLRRGDPDHRLTIAEPLAFIAPVRVYEGRAVELSFLMLEPAAVRSAWLYYRRRGERTYERAELSRAGDGYVRQRIPGDAVRPSGLEYFVKVLHAGEPEPTAVIGSAADPRAIVVDRTVEEPPPDRDDRSRVTLFMDYVNFDGSSEFDRYLLAEIDFMYRFRRPVYAVRLGFGALGGTGGPKDIIDDNPEACTDEAGTFHCHRVNFHYAFAETELRLHELVHVMARGMTGSAYTDGTPDETNREHFSALGMRARLRIGREEATNLVLGYGVVQDFGMLFEASFTWDVIPLFPIVLSAHVTDQPVPEDFGVRLIADVGWRGLSWMYPSIRLAYQARDLDHAGISAGAAINFDW